MDFITEEKKVAVSTVSKSFLQKVEDCPLRVWNEKRDPVTASLENNTRSLRVGTRSHEYFAKHVSTKFGKKRPLSVFSDPAIDEEAKELAGNVDYFSLTKDCELLGVEETFEVQLPSGLTLSGIFDAVFFCRSIEYGDHILVVEYKTSIKVKKELDNEALVYLFAAAKIYNADVRFLRISGREFAGVYHRFYFKADALGLEKPLDALCQKSVRIVENDEKPFPNISSRCYYCPFLEECSAKEYDVTKPEELVAKMKFHELQAKKLKDSLKQIVLASDEPIQAGNYIAKKSTSVSYRAKTSDKNDVVMDLLLDARGVDEVKPALKFSVVPDILPVIDRYNETAEPIHQIIVTPVARTSVKIEEIEEEDE